MDDQYEESKVFITVMTYPRPSQKYVEVICTAGITEEGQWIRLLAVTKFHRVFSNFTSFASDGQHLDTN